MRFPSLYLSANSGRHYYSLLSINLPLHYFHSFFTLILTQKQNIMLLTRYYNILLPILKQRKNKETILPASLSFPNTLLQKYPKLKLYNIIYYKTL